jgi:hypothetical protein
MQGFITHPCKEGAMKDLIKLLGLQISAIAFLCIASCGPMPPVEDDTDAPVVTVTDPAEAANGIAVNYSVSATFSEEMDSATINDSSFTLQNGNEAVPGSVNCSGTTATFTPAAELEYNTSYTATITTAATDAAGNPIETDYAWTFTTGVGSDATPPVPGNSGLLAVFDINKIKISISLTKATDNASPEPDLQYRLYVSVNGNISTVEDIEANGTPVNEFTASIESLTADNLEFDTQYYFNVIVKDTSNNKAAYLMLSASTPKNKTKGILFAYNISSGEQPLSVQAMEDALNSLGYPYEEIADTNNYPAFRALKADSLTEYYAVFYVGVPSADTIDLLTEYMDKGGSLYITDNDIGYNKRDSVFYKTYLQSSYVADNGGDVLSGQGIFTGFTMDITSDPYPDAFSVESEGECIFKYIGNPYAGGVAINRNGYRAIYTAFDFRYISNSADAAALVERVADYICGEYF